MHASLHTHTHTALTPFTLPRDKPIPPILSPLRYMAQGLLLFQPALTKSAAQYRINSAPVAEGIATTFGYEGMMFAWTSAAKGNPFGCCNGQCVGIVRQSTSAPADEGGAASRGPAAAAWGPSTRSARVGRRRRPAVQRERRRRDVIPKPQISKGADERTRHILRPPMPCV